MKPLAVALLVAAVVGAATRLASKGASVQHASRWMVISSTRDGEEHALNGQTYALRPDGSRLTSLLGRESPLSPVEVSPDGRLIAYENIDTYAVYVSRADGTRLRRLLPPSRGLQLGSLTFSPDASTVAVVRYDGSGHPHLFVVDADGGNIRRLGRAGAPDWSPDGSMLAAYTGRGCVVTTAPFTTVLARIRGACGYPKFSPNGASLAFATGARCAVVRTPLPGRLAALPPAPRRLPGSCAYPEWSPDGRWIASLSPGCEFCDSAKARRAARKELGVWAVHPDGSGRHRVAPADEESGADYSWSPDGSQLAITVGSRLLLASPAGRARRIGPLLASNSETPPLWSADSSRLTMAAQTGNDPAQIWSIRADGTDLRRLTSAGVNDIVGFVNSAPAHTPVPPLEPSERVLGPRLLATGKPIGRLAADGGAVAYIAGSTETDCEHVSVWTPSTTRIERVSTRLPAPCDYDYTSDVDVYELALAGPMVAWSTNLGCGNSGCGVDVHTARLPGADPVEVDFDDGEDYGNEFLRPFDPVGRGRVLAVESHVRVEEPGGGVRRCKLPGDQDAWAVDGGRLAVSRSREVVVVDDHCQVVSRVGLDTKGLKTVLLDRAHVIAARAGSLEVYDTNGGLVEQRPLEPGVIVEGAFGGVVVLRSGTVVTALRLADGRSVAFRPCLGPVLAAIGDAGLYYSYRTPAREGRLALVPRKELERRLATGSSYEPRCLRSTKEFATARGPIALAAADLNGDGRPDLVSANESARSVSVLLGPDFRSRRDYRLAAEPNSVALSDLDVDGHLDVVVTLETLGGVSVLRNHGDGSLEAPKRYRAGRDVSGLAIGDVNGDGAPDVAVASVSDNAVSILLNRGDGVLGHRHMRAVESPSSSLAIADVTGDGTADVTVARGSDSRVVVLVGRGDGTFRRAEAFPTSSENVAVAVANLDGKGRLDLAVLDGCAPALLLARRGAGFSKPHEVDDDVECGGGLAVSAGDVNGDGRADLVTATPSSGFPLRLEVFFNRGGGRFMRAGTYDALSSDYASPTVVQDLNGDGRADLAVPVYARGTVAVLMNTLGVCHVRDFRGLTVAEAASRLGRARCHVGHVHRVRASRGSKGRVVAAVPRFGAFWPHGPAVDLLVRR